MGCRVIPFKKKHFKKQEMGGLKLESYLLNKQRPIKSHGKNTCVIDFVWDQVKGKKGFKTYDYDKLKDEIYEFVPEGDMISTEELINWAKDCHPNISIHAFDSRYRNFVRHTNNCSNIVLVFVVKDHHLFPVTNEKLKNVACKASQGGCDDLLKHMTELKWTRRHENIVKIGTIHEITNIKRENNIIILPKDVKMKEAIEMYVKDTNYYVEYLHWNNRGMLDGFIDHRENMYLLKEEYNTIKTICDKLFDIYKTHDFKWCNQSYTSIASALFRQLNGYLPESSYNINTRKMLDDFYPRALQWCTTEDIPEEVINIDICKSYPSILLNNTQPIPVLSYLRLF